MAKRAVVGDVCLNLNESWGLTRVVTLPSTKNEICGVAGLVISTGAILGVELSEPVTRIRYWPAASSAGGTQRYSI